MLVGSIAPCQGENDDIEPRGLLAPDGRSQAKGQGTDLPVGNAETLAGADQGEHWTFVPWIKTKVQWPP